MQYKESTVSHMTNTLYLHHHWRKCKAFNLQGRTHGLVSVLNQLHRLLVQNFERSRRELSHHLPFDSASTRLRYASRSNLGSSGFVTTMFSLVRFWYNVRRCRVWRTASALCFALCRRVLFCVFSFRLSNEICFSLPFSVYGILSIPRRYWSLVGKTVKDTKDERRVSEDLFEGHVSFWTDMRRILGAHWTFKGFFGVLKWRTAYVYPRWCGHYGPALRDGL